MGPIKFTRASQEFWSAIERRAGSRKAIAAALRQAGHQISESSIGMWIRGETEPDFSVHLWCSEKWDVSIDELRLGRPFQESVSEQLAALAQRQDRLEGRLHAWEIEWAAAAGQEPPESFEAGGPISLADHAFRRRVEELEKAVQRLREQQA